MKKVKKDKTLSRCVDCVNQVRTKYFKNGDPPITECRYETYGKQVAMFMKYCRDFIQK